MSRLRAVVRRLPDDELPSLWNTAGVAFGALSVLIFLHYFLAGGLS